MLALAGLAVVLAPWLYRSRSALNEARAQRVRADARADMAAHLHDSVLQTLALIQRQSDDPKAVSQLARRQERELRTWLYEPAVATGGTWAGLVADTVAAVEDDHALTVDSVVVGDAPLDDALAALLAATREAVVNAAKHSGADRVDVYAERVPNGDGERVEVFVRDRGKGFDPDAIAEDRLGVRNSIVGRVERHGGTARVRSSGDGTEVALTMPVTPPRENP